MEEKQIGEQPQELQNNVQEGIVKDEDMGTSCSDSSNGSLGKFKDAESLLEAYNNLQAEFTKKCQKLSEVSKSLENLEAEKQSQQMPVFNGEGWEESVADFLEKNSEAKKYSGEIAQEILNDASLQTSPNALELAWARVMKKEYALPENLAKDQNFINEQILSQDQIKKQVLDEYFKNLQNVKTPPVIARNGVVASITQKEPSNLKEAKQMVEKLFNLKG